MKKIQNLKDLVGYQLLSLHDAETQMAETLYELAPQCASKELRKLFEQSALQANANAVKLEAIMEKAEVFGYVKPNAVLRDLGKELRDLPGVVPDKAVSDAARIVAHQCMNHYLIAKYGSLAAFVRLLEEDGIAAALHEIMELQKKEDEALSRLATETINKKAKESLVL